MAACAPLRARCTLFRWACAWQAFAVGCRQRQGRSEAQPSLHCCACSSHSRPGKLPIASWLRYPPAGPAALPSVPPAAGSAADLPDQMRLLGRARRRLPPPLPVPAQQRRRPARQSTRRRRWRAQARLAGTGAAGSCAPAAACTPAQSAGHHPTVLSGPLQREQGGQFAAVRCAPSGGGGGRAAGAAAGQSRMGARPGLANLRQLRSSQRPPGARQAARGRTATLRPPEYSRRLEHLPPRPVLPPWRREAGDDDRGPRGRDS